MNRARGLAVVATGLWALLSGACEAGVTEPLEAPIGPPAFLIGGEPDFAHTNVGAVVTFIPFLPDNPLQPFCTGTLIAPDVVVTTGHCAFLLVEFDLPVWFTFDQQFSETSPLIPATAIPHPDFSPSRNPLDVGGVDRNLVEVGVLLLADPVKDVAPAMLPRPGLLDELRRQGVLRAGAEFSVVGYGAVAIEDGFPVWDGQRRSMNSPFGSLLPTAVQLGNANQKHTPSACFGDSGGPNFFEIDGDAVLTSVTWWIGGGPLAGPNLFELNCASWHRAYRLDIPEARSFLRNFVDLP
ncbi:MAG TPA: trypsin-like serine protease [Longimicrobiales bacterium]|nr:trypsin-like serine protease [Longimicrobiales bacterium]